jgi:protein O-GlcNAc transferase
MAQLSLQQTFDLAIQHHQAGRFQEAERLYKQILAQQPTHIDALHNLGAIALQSRRYDIAANLLRQAIAVKPDFPEAYSNLGIALRNLGELDEAIAALRQAVSLNANFAEAHSNLADALKEKGAIDEAIAAYRRALALKPNLPEIHNNLGNALKDKGQVDEAIAEYRRAIALNPNLADAFNNLANALKDKGILDGAVAAFRRAIVLRPSFAEAYSNLAVALRDQGQLDEAIAALRRAIALKPDYYEAYNNLGSGLKDQGQLDQAIDAYRQSLTVRPMYTIADSNLIYTLHFHPAYDAQAIAEEHRRWNRQHAWPLRQFLLAHTNDRDPNRRLRVGYVSPDLRMHPVARFLLPLAANHDHGQFEIFCYSSVRSPDDITARLRSYADVWREVHGFSNEQTADLIRNDRIDILVDLSMHMAGNRMLLFARKPAPIQITYLAYCSTTGLETMDYRITDPHLDPPGRDESIYSERTIRLPRSYWCYESPMQGLEASPLPAAGNGLITFACLNNFCKITPDTVRTWAKLLKRVPRARLLLHAAPGSHRQALTNELSQGGVDPNRLQFLDRLPLSDYLRQYEQIDIALDPFPYVGGTTTCDALWMGVPVVTLRGSTAVARGGGSILSNIGLSELIAESPEQYIQIATDLANDLPRLSRLRSQLREQMLRSPLMDAPQFARDMEAIYRRIWRDWCEKSAGGT